MASDSGEQYFLRWNHHQSNVLQMFENLFQTGSFCDVTLACEGVQIKCHKIVLAFCSSYFRNLLLDNDYLHPIIILAGIQLNELRTILEFMYRGQVTVDQDKFAGVLKAAETLKVKGLTLEEQTPSSPTRASPAPRFQPFGSSPLHTSSSPEEMAATSTYPYPPFWRSPPAPLRPRQKVTLDNSQSLSVPLKRKKKRLTVSPYRPKIQVRGVSPQQNMGGGSPRSLESLYSSPGGASPENNTRSVPPTEMKRYKQYTHNDVMFAVEAVKEGASVLQTARDFHIPSRTLYEKLRKLGVSPHHPGSGSGHSPNEHSTELRRNDNGNETALSGYGCKTSCEKPDSGSELELLEFPR